MPCMIDYKAADHLLKDKVILVTGAGDGIGRVAAKTFAAYGATLVLLGRTISKLEAVYDEIEVAGGAQPAIYPLNLEGATHKDYVELGERLGETFGRLDGLLHNASLLGKITPLEAYHPELWQQVMQVNCNAPFMLTQGVLGALKASEDASVIFTSSSVGRRARAFWGAYAVSKFATEGLMQVLADELEHTGTIRVNSINPGATRTQMRRKAYPGEDPQSLLTPEEIMPTYLYLMGADSRGVTGQAFDAQS
ncbi:NAD(P)-dependent dehydrogenase, short-chain alcohol dehydrogenase family [Allopseudospirillum japonicum]|uniref:NAD(P)-dependent dehydrogenase, short-chain alcohol dehydrogenase family n=1 Tax=Allopseudospirillum japonicum TaxID=64971 RepID=A0A1H6Q250_9GAMM|nr:YciK family oxidoreductase [Allopseudospirillum japonicum]SEI37913.1 NAD(P)-dependent dehydrogenase, short-chain alcohol dehydrogenase family [Allopseudospirillum japonicum]